MSQSEASDVDSDVESESAFMKRETERCNLMNEWFKWSDKAEDALGDLIEKCGQRDKVGSTLVQLSKMLKEKERKLEGKKEAYVEMTEDQRVKIAEIRDDIKMMGEVMRVKQLEKGQRDQEVNAFSKTWKNLRRHRNKLEEEYRKFSEESDQNQ
ncbi:unnamed protein product [Caenorhabditis brenneri]